MTESGFAIRRNPCLRCEDKELCGICELTALRQQQKKEEQAFGTTKELIYALLDKAEELENLTGKKPTLFLSQKHFAEIASLYIGGFSGVPIDEHAVLYGYECVITIEEQQSYVGYAIDQKETTTEKG
jgi:hypothetical protein